MAEVGVDISRHRSRQVDELADVAFDVVYTVCGHAHENCPVFPGQVRIEHRGFGDPPRLTRNLTDEEEILAIYRQVRDSIRDWIAELPEARSGS
jgi:arsenate reductase